MRRRAVGLRGFVYFVGTHTRSTVPLGRSAAALGAIIEGPQILITCHVIRVGKKGVKAVPLARSVAGPQETPGYYVLGRCIQQMTHNKP